MSKDRERDRDQPTDGLGLDLKKIRRQALGSLSDEAVMNRYFEALVQTAVVFFVDEKNWYLDYDDDNELQWTATTEIAFPLDSHLGEEAICKLITQKLQKALGPSVTVLDICTECRNCWYGQLTCVKTKA